MSYHANLRFDKAMKQILNSRISIWHFTVVLILAVLLCSFMYILGIPIAYWSAFGEGEESSRIDNLGINILIQNWGALIFVLFACAISLAVNFKREKFHYAKSYLITMMIVVVLYLIRLQIGNFLIEIFS